MSNNKQKNRTNKKPAIETTLGQAIPPIEQPEIPDLSILKKPIDTNIVGIKQLLSLSDNATVEVQNYVNYECDILYECRLCRAIFRSLANFILHKRNYCTERFTRSNNSENSSGFVIDEATINANVDKDCDKEPNKKGLTPVLEKLYKKQQIAELTKTVLTSDLSNDLQNYNQTSNGDDCLILQKIDDNNTAVYQTLSKQGEESNLENASLMKSEVMEIHGIFDNNEAVLGVDGKICDFATTKKLIGSNIPKPDLVCTECNFKFSTKKTLTSHIKYKHNKTCKVYPCPDCKETFANAWSVYRHLDKVHKRTQAQIRRVRLQVSSNAITKEQNIINNNLNNNKKKNNKLASIKEDEENQWMNNLECDGDLRMCGGCGKKFERRAALQSHSQTCLRRIAVCSVINSKQQQQKPATTTTTTTQKEQMEATIKQPSDLLILKGSAKRKTKKIKLNNNNNNNTNNNNNDNEGLANVKIVDVAEIFNQKQETNQLNSIDTDSMLDILGITKQNLPNKTDDGLNSSSSSSSSSNDSNNNNNNNNDNNEIYNISDESCHSSPELFQFNHSDDVNNHDNKPVKKLKLSPTTLSMNELDYLTDDTDENFLLKASPYMKRNELKCISCQTYYASRYQLLWHMSLHFSWYRFQCAKCPFMSFNRYDCADHAYLKHCTTVNLIDSTVLPIPKWKIISMSHDFIKLDSNKLRDRNVPKPLKKRNRKQQPQSTNNNNNNNNNRLETIILEDDDIDILLEKLPNTDEVDDNINDDDDNNSNNRDIETIELLDDEKDPLANENETIPTETLKIETVVTNNRPVRTRTRSYKTLQNDFIYDLGKVLKLNDNAIKHSLAKVKKK